MEQETVRAEKISSIILEGVEEIYRMTAGEKMSRPRFVALYT